MGSGQSLGLPAGTGPHQVACTDVMVGLKQKSCFFRLYYPCLPHEITEQPLWIPHYQYCRGLAEYLNLNSKWWTALLSMAYGSCKVPVSWNGPFKPTCSKYPLIIFSHGLGAFRTLYSSVCMEMASRGFLVVAVEHRDRSASATYFYKADSLGGDCPKAPLEEEWLAFQKVQAGQKEFHLRKSQVHQRANECVRALSLMRDVNSGKAVTNILQTGFELSELKNSVDLDKVAVMGHSFGGATALLTLIKDDLFKCAVALDAWMFPVRDDLYCKMRKPVLFINTESFQTVTSVTKMKRLSARNNQTKIITILGSVHQSQTDFTFLVGAILSKVFETRGTIDPYVGLEITNRASLAFLQKHLDLKEEFHQWSDLLEGIGIHVIPDAPFLQSSL
ncbi:platelet-activating factor acetylhydrolase 2, cytoplasmic isoform X1 [Rhinatrema bivittatum]|nr:platelet-activating factor acetylhydrolase 2, cytoplasmic isoform X1 [Rhinatrema bivittatum]XP_029426959.1 platelet-activating factor acetylhydrolase 2, cytoplasmic isoform X1 [Rhinatrema bivittatum]XP_029426960.1 platelet-activating factor acetylhydrolase 2, cytoplasmic isoform X1 [Rhinatrema bivittatum]XP_029426961.1 platelet-activating factor acetylhydrolase 2, cytoplasmic isoform X1 [Rhinatrema bivittatum]